MAQVRGLMVLGAVQYIKDTFGPEGHERTVRAMPPERQRTFLIPIRDAGFGPLEDFIDYLDTAHRVLGPDDEQFHHKLGHASGRRERETGGFKVMVADPASAMRMGPTIWKTFYDVGRLEIEVRGPRELIARVYDFPGARCLCERSCGAWEGLLSGEGLAAKVGEIQCAHRAAPHCEFDVRWTPEA